MLSERGTILPGAVKAGLHRQQPEPHGRTGGVWGGLHGAGMAGMYAAGYNMHGQHARSMHAA